MNRPQIRVAAGVLENDRGLFLAAQRPPGKIAAGKWEFPGGKIEAGETPEQALVRELGEELGIAVTTYQPLIRISHSYSDRDVHMWVYRVTRWEGKLQAHDGQAFCWGDVTQLRALDLLGADGPILQALELPSVLPLTPVSADLATVTDLAARWQSRGLTLARLRLPALDDLAYADVFAETQANSGLRWIADRSVQMALDLDAAGFHARADLAARLEQRPVPNSMLFGVSCHDQFSWERARALGADYALLSPVQATQSHPDSEAMGWSRFAEIVSAGSLPTYALGGMRPDDARLARGYWGQGVSGIQAFS